MNRKLTNAERRDIWARWWQTEITRLSKVDFAALESTRLRVSPITIFRVLAERTPH